MELQKFIDILGDDSNKAIDFFEKYGKDIFKKKDLLLVLLDLKWSEKTYRKLDDLAWIIFVEFTKRSIRKKKHFDLLPIYDHFQKYIYAGGFIGNKGVPFKEWEDLAKGEIELLKTLIKENKLEKYEDDKRYYKLCVKYEDRIEELIKKGYDQLTEPFV